MTKDQLELLNTRLKDIIDTALCMIENVPEDDVYGRATKLFLEASMQLYSERVGDFEETFKEWLVPKPALPGKIF